ncbi:MAG: GAF domain-containing protein [Desulfobacteraceae bacterium]|jgi:transcriptional regulator with GAF, ATPase, and Fis domain|nr:MAG: GAF domain-containing protein [Desulfobacteraceae bacterium]
MPWSVTPEYELLLKLNNTIIRNRTRESLFGAIASEIKKIFHYDRCSINLYDPATQSLSYFATADGIRPDGITCRTSRPLPKGSVANRVIETRKPVIIEDLSKDPGLTTADTMLMEGLTCTMAFPLIIRDDFLGSFHVAFKKQPEDMEDLMSFLEDISVQITIAVDNMLSYEKLKKINEKLEQQKQYVLRKIDRLDKDFYFTSDLMTEIMNDLDLVANSDTSVFITGETGTGKGHIARHIHNLSHRREQLFVKVNCAALAPTLIESELFGHAKGSFTGAAARRTGRFEMADGGTVFLDEIGELPLQSQAKLLQVLEDKSFERVGESRPISVDFRVISATNQDLKKKMREQKFRRDLYYRLNTIHIRLPPLREHPEDIPLLIRCFTTRFAERMKKPEATYSPSAIDELCRYRWPGNVREVQNIVERLMIHRGGHMIMETDIRQLLHSVEPGEAPATEDKFLTRAEMEKRHIEKALAACNGAVGGKHGAARLLGIPRSTLQYRMKKLGIST